MVEREPNRHLLYPICRNRATGKKAAQLEKRMIATAAFVLLIPRFSQKREISSAFTVLLKVDFGSRSQSWVPDFYSTFVKKWTLKATLLDFKSGKSCLDLTPPPIC